MRLCDMVGDAWGGGQGPTSPDYYESYIGLSPGNHEHAPSLRNPIKTKIPTAQDGWHPGDSKAAKRQAMRDLVEIHKRLRRQIGRPAIARTAAVPVYSDYGKNVPG